MILQSWLGKGEEGKGERLSLSVISTTYCQGHLLHNSWIQKKKKKKKRRKKITTGGPDIVKTRCQTQLLPLCQPQSICYNPQYQSVLCKLGHLKTKTDPLHQNMQVTTHETCRKESRNKVPPFPNSVPIAILLLWPEKYARYTTYRSWTAPCFGALSLPVP